MRAVAIVRSATNALVVDAVAGRLYDHGVDVAALDQIEHLDRMEPSEGVVLAGDPPATPAAVDAIAGWGATPRVVLLSSPAAPHERSLPPEHQWFLPAERRLQASHLRWVIVRPVGLMAATLSWRSDIARGVVRHPYIDAGYPHVHEHDVADVIVSCLLSDAHLGSKLMVTGPASITPTEQTESLARALGQPLRIEELTPDQARQRWRDAGWDDDSIELELALLADYVDDPPRVRDTVERVTGSPGRDFDQWATEHAGDF